MKVYLVLSIDFESKSGATHLFLEKEKAVELANSLSGFNYHYSQLSHGPIWVYKTSNKDYLAIQEFELDSNADLNTSASLDKINEIASQISSQNNIVAVDDPFADDLPGGFNYNGKPIKMKDVKEAPLDVWEYSDLYLDDTKEAALVLARIKHRPNFKYVYAGTTYNQKESFDLIKNKTPIGSQIIRDEIILLEDHLNELRDYEEESSSSSSSEEEDSDY